MSLVQQHGGGRLHALVNNAGIVTGSLVDLTTMEEYSRVMEVNCIGHVRMTKSLLPALLPRRRGERGGRVVVMTSVAGIVGAAGMSAYCCSKSALEAFSDCLRREMGPRTHWRLDVSVLEPSVMRTPMVTSFTSTRVTDWDSRDQAGRERLGKACYDTLQRQAALAIRTMDDPAKVVQAYMHAITALHPCTHYTPGLFSVLVYLLSLLPTALQDLLMSTYLTEPPAYFSQTKEATE